MFDPPARKLRAAREKAGYASAADACRYYGWGYAAYVHHENGTRGIPKDAAIRYAAAFGKKTGLTVGDLLGLREDVEVANGVTVEGVVAMGVWHDIELDEQESHRPFIKVPRTQKPRGRRALHVMDESVNKAIAAGEYAIYVPMDGDMPPMESLAGQLVYAECRVNRLVERSIRMAQMTRDGRLKLTAHSTSPKFSSVVYFPCKEGKVALLGRIVGKYADWDAGYPQKK
jgi:hypothetical protein